ncbi:AAA family ATPase [Tenacibaculum maritimum]|uniref:AAA family ATPase n=1 Tax=Tenacibaculum maritimum TaxID=107401 RepID=UPI0038761BD4
MKIKKIRIQNFRSIEGLTIDLSENLNVFVGINGSGKTSVLDALSISLSWLVNRIQRQNASGSRIHDDDIRYDAPFSSIELLVQEKRDEYVWKIIKAAKGTNVLEKSELSQLSELATQFQEDLSEKEKLPVIAYYPVSRVVDRTTPTISRRDSLYILDVYDNALSGKRNYHSFFEWFRTQDDILNEKAMSRSKWMEQNRIWIKRRVKNIIDLIKDSFNFQGIDEEFSYRVNRLLKDKILYKKPRIFFHELSRLIRVIGKEESNKTEKIFHDLEYMFHRMEIYSEEYRDDLISSDERYEEVILDTIHDFRFVFKENGRNPQLLRLFWEIFSFANILSLWWISERGRKKLEMAFREPLFRERQGFEFFGKVFYELQLSIKQIIKSELLQKKKAYRSEGQELRTVAKAIEQFVPEYSSLRVKRLPRPHMLIDKGGLEYNLNQLSDGEKNLITLVGDIARRLAIANPHSKSPLKGNGIILIDEIDMHLHPSWQRLMIPKLLKIFPNCQFIVTTHSPQIISHIKPENLFLFEQKNNSLSFKKIKETYGMSIERVVENIMNDEARPIKTQKALDEIFESIASMKLVEAKELIEKLKIDMPRDPEILRAEMLIRKAELKK